MFEGLIKRILITLFGKFIDGIDKNHIQLGVLSGNLIIEGVSIKKEVLDQLELPIQLIYSSIQRIQIVLPWNKLSSQRTEVRIKNVFLLATTKDKKDWNLKDINSFVKKIGKVEVNIRKVMEEEMKNKKIVDEQFDAQKEPELKDVGYFKKMISRIIDNLYVSIQNVHFRYEHSISKHTFSWGITIHKIEQQTVENDWKSPKILDRFDQKNKENSINKIIQLERLALYWKSDDRILYNQFSDAQIQQKMQQELVFEVDLGNNQQAHGGNQKYMPQIYSKYIYCLNAMAKVVQAYYHHYKTPEYKINIELHEMDFKIQHTQYQEIIKLFQVFNEYQYNVKVQRDMFKITAIKPDKSSYSNKPLKLFYQNYFVYLVYKVMQENMRRKFIEYTLQSLNKKTKPQKLFKGKEFRDEQRNYQQIVLKSSVETLEIWTQAAMDIFHKSSSHSGWWKNQSKLKQKQEEENIRKEIEKALRLQNQSNIDMESYVYLEFSLIMVQGSLKLMRKHKNLEEGFTLSWKKFDLQLKKRQNNFEMEQSIQEMEVQMFSVEEKNDIIVPIVKKIRTYEQQDKPLIYFKLEKHPLFKPNYFSSLYLEVQQIEIMLFIASMRRIITYFRLPPTEERPPQRIDLAKTTRKGVNTIIEYQTQNDIRITIQSPILIIPNKQINDLNSDCYVLKLGDLDILTLENSEPNNQKNIFQRMATKLGQAESPSKRSLQFSFFGATAGQNDNFKKSKFSQIVEKQIESSRPSTQKNYDGRDKQKSSDAKIYDRYTLKLDSVQLQYFSSIHFFYNYQKLSNTPRGLELLNHPLRVKSIKVDIIDKFSIELNLNFIKGVVSQTPGKPQTKIHFDLPQLKISLQPLIPHTFSKLSETINDFSSDQTLSSILQQEKQKLIKYSTCKGYLRKRGTFLRSWSSFYVVLSGWYLYLYQNENDNDFYQYIGLRDLQIQEAQNDIGVLYSFRLKNPNLKEIHYFQAQSLQELKKWLKYIQQKVHDIKQKLSQVPTTAQQVYYSMQNKQSMGGQRLSHYQFVESQGIQTKLKFNIQKIEIELKYDDLKTTDTVIKFNHIKLKSIQKLSESYQQFSIQSITLEDDSKYILKSIKYSQPQTPIHNKKKSNNYVDKMIKKQEKMQEVIKQRNFKIKGAVNIRIYQQEIPQFNQINILILLSDLEARYKSSFLLKLSSFFSTPKDNFTPNSKKEIDDRLTSDYQPSSLSNTLIFGNVPQAQQSSDRTRMYQDEMSQFASKTKNQTKTIKSFTLQKSISDSEGIQDDQQDEILEASSMILQIISQEMKLILETNSGKEFLQMNIVKLSGKITRSEDQFQCDGSLSKIEIVDLVSLKNPHIFLGHQSYWEKQRSKSKKVNGLTIFSITKYNDEQQEEEDSNLQLQMLEFKYVNIRNPSKIVNHVSTEIFLTVRNCFIDYLHETILKVGSNFKEQETLKTNKPQSKTKLDAEQEQDFEKIAKKLQNPVLQKINVILMNPKIYVKPPNQSNQSFELQMKQIQFDLENNKEKNRIIANSQKLSKKQTQVVSNLECIWCQNILFTADTMRIIINSNSEQTLISNNFSAVLRFQQPLFISEYETLFPNITIDKNKEFRLKVTSIELNLLRQNYQFLVEVFTSQLLKKQSKAEFQSRQKNETHHDQQQYQESIWIFKLDSLAVKIMDFNNDYSNYGTIKIPLVDFMMNETEFQYQLKPNQTQFIRITVKEFMSHYYQYIKHHEHVQIKTQGIINSLMSRKEKLEVYLDQQDQPPKLSELDIKSIQNELKGEFYEEDDAKKDSQLDISVTIDQDRNQQIVVYFQESKILINGYYLEIIKDFFTMPKKKARPFPEEYLQEKSVAQEKESTSLLDLSFKMSKCLILLHEENQKELICVQCELDAQLEETFDDIYHQAYHQLHKDKDNQEYQEQMEQMEQMEKMEQMDKMEKNQKLKVTISQLQLFSSNYEKLIKLNLKDRIQLKLFRKKQILKPTLLEIISEKFKCNCHESYQTCITEDTIRLEKVRVSISYNDMILLSDTLKYQQEQMKQSKNAFKEIDEESINEDMIYQLPVKPAMQASIIDVPRTTSRKNTSKLVNAFNQINVIKGLKSKSTLQLDDQMFQMDGIEDEVVSEIQSANYNQQRTILKVNKPTNNFGRRSIILESFEIIVINDLNKSHVPLILFPLSIKELIIENNENTNLIFGEINVGLMFFNPIASKMEPIVESTDFQLQIINNKESQPKLSFLIQKDEVKSQQFSNASLNINVSAQMVHTLVKTLKQWQQKYHERVLSQDIAEHKSLNHQLSRLDQRRISKLQQLFGSAKGLNTALVNQVNKENSDMVTLFTIINKTGLFIKVTRIGENIEEIKQSEQVDLMNGEQKNYQIPSDDQEFAKTFEQDIKIMLRFEYLQQQYKLTNIPIEQTGPKIVQWNAHHNNSTNHKYYLIVQTEIENFQKSIHLFSPYIVYNKTDCTIILKQILNSNSKSISIEPNTEASLHLELVQDQTQITIQFADKKYSRTSKASEQIKLSDIFEKKRIIVRHGQLNSYYYTQVSLNQHKIQGANVIDLNPAFIIYNLLPVPIEMHFFTQENAEFQTQMLSQFQQNQTIQKQADSSYSRGNSLSGPQLFAMESIQSNEQNLQKSQIQSELVFDDTNIKIINGMIELMPQAYIQLNHIQQQDQLSVQFRIDGFSMSNKILLYNPNTRDYHNSVPLSDIDQKITGHLDVYVDREFTSQTKSIYFYVKNCIINTTPYQLKYFTYEDNKVIQLPGQKDHQFLYHNRQNFEKTYNQIQVSNKIKHFMIGLLDIEMNISNEVDVSILGSVGLQIKSKGISTYSLYEFGIQISVANISQRKGIYTKVIEIMPRFVIVNNSGHSLNICQAGCENMPIRLIQDERIPLVWTDCRAEKAIQIQKADPKGRYTWSGNVYISELKSAHFYSSLIQESQSVSQINPGSQDISRSRIFDKDSRQFSNLKKYDPNLLNQLKQEQKLQFSIIQSSQSIEFFRESIFLNAEITKNKATMYVQIESQQEPNYAFKISNQCTNLLIGFQQDTAGSKYEWTIQPSQISPFAWEHPSLSLKLKIKFINIINNKLIHTEQVDFQQQQKLRQIEINQNGKPFIIRIESEFQGQTRLITIKEDDLTQKSLTQSNMIKNENSLAIDKFINIHIPSLGISLIMRKQKANIEANYIYLKQVEFGILQTPITTTAQFRIKFINIDNNTSLNTTTPILLTLQRCQQALKDHNYYFLEANIRMDQNVKAISSYDFIHLSIKPFICQIDEEYVSCVIETSKYIQQQLELNSDESLQFNGMLHSIKSLVFSTPERRYHLLRLMSELDGQLEPYLIWNSIEINHSKKLQYIKELSLSTLDITFSFHKRYLSTRNDQEENVFNLFSTAIGATIQNINEASIILEAFGMRSIYDSQDIIFISIQDHYKSEMLKALLKILGSIEIIGNPVRLIQQVTNGVKDFIEMPVQGIRHGPIEFGVGVFKGTGSLIKNTVAGAFYSVNKVTGSISSSVSLLSMDDEFMEQRRINMLKRPNHLIDGLSQAGRSIYNGFTDGITGVILSPYRETQRDGVRGLFKGTLKGLTGLVVKPIAGVLDASAKTAEGVVNTATHFDDKPNDVRIRYSRVFYERTKYFSRYNERDSKIMNFLQTYLQGRFANIDYKDAFEQESSEQQLQIIQKRILQATKQIHECFSQCSRILVISHQVILIIDGINMGLVQEIDPKIIKKISIENNNQIIISTHDQEFPLQIDIKEKNQAIEAIRYVIEQVKDQC